MLLNFVLLCVFGVVLIIYTKDDGDGGDPWDGAV